MNTNNPKPEKPNLREWSKNNPGMTINDYFKIYGTDTNSLNSDRYSFDYEVSRIKNELNKEKSKNASWLYMLIPLFLLIAFLSNPKIEDHREALKIKLSGIVDEILSEETDNIFIIGLGKYFGDTIVNENLKNVSADNYLFFSLTEFKFASNTKIIGYGFLGKVYFSNNVNKQTIKNIKNN
jgi:hypothetical protein